MASAGKSFDRFVERQMSAVPVDEFEKLLADDVDVGHVVLVARSAAARPDELTRVRREQAKPAPQQDQLTVEEADQDLEPVGRRVGLEQCLTPRQARPGRCRTAGTTARSGRRG